MSSTESEEIIENFPFIKIKRTKLVPGERYYIRLNP